MVEKYILVLWILIPRQLLNTFRKSKLDGGRGEISSTEQKSIYLNIWDTAEAMLREKFIGLNVCVRKS